MRGTEYKAPFTVAGKINHHVHKFLPLRLHESLSGPFTGVTFTKVRLSQRDKLIDWLLFNGWEYDPEMVTPKGRPKLTDKGEPVESLMSHPVGKVLGDYYLRSHRLSFINGLLRDVDDNGFIHPGAATIGTNTHRFRHSIVVNTPKASDKVFFGKEIRSCFIAREGYKIVGVDASGLESRITCHWANDAHLTKTVFEGDFHTAVWKALGKWMKSRDTTKNVNYAYPYGAQNEKLGSMADENPDQLSNEELGAQMRAAIAKLFPGLGKLQESVTKASERGYLRSLDGRRIYLRRTPYGKVKVHTALNTLNQSSGSIIMKRALVILIDKLLEADIDFYYLLNFHDEFQFDIREDQVEEASVMFEDSIREAGEYYNLNVPLEGEAKVGNSWAETH